MNKNILGSFAVFTLLVLTIGSVAAFYDGNGFVNPNLSEEEIANMHEFRNSVQNAITEGNYKEWKSLMESQITEEQFIKLLNKEK